MTARARLCVPICAVSLLALSAASAHAAVDELVLISRQSVADGGAGADDHSTLVSHVWSTGQSKISHDGRYVAFDSEANNLHALEDDQWPNAFVRHEAMSTTTLINPQVAGTGAGHAAISADGTRAAFTAGADLSPADTNGTADVYVRDLQTDTLTFVPCGGDPPGCGGVAPSLSADGLRVAFHDPNSHVETGLNGGVFMHDVETNTTTLVSRQSTADGGAPADGNTGGAAISADGSHVAFVSDATNLSADGPGLDVFVRDLQTNTTTLVSHARAGDDGAGAIEYGVRPSISRDGRYVAFEGGPAFTCCAAVWVRDLQMNTTTLVSRQSAADGGAPANGAAESPTISADGRYVAFDSVATNLTPEGAQGVFVRDLHDARTMLVSRRATADGGAVAEGRSLRPVISGDGHHVAFESEAENLSTIDQDALTDIFRARISFADDETAPQIAITTPPDGAVYARGAVVLADYACTEEDGGSGLAACAGPVADGDAIDTAALGARTFTVTARDKSGNERSLTHRYTLIDATPPTVTLRTPPDGATYAVGQEVLADYECADESGGSGLESCVGTVANGAAIDTGSAGDKTLTVTAQDQASNTRVVTHTYHVAPPTCDGRPATIVGSGRIRGTPAADVIVGSDGRDIIDGRGSADRICAGAGNDRLSGGRGRDRLFGESGRDELFGGNGDDRLRGGAGADELFGDDGDDRLAGGRGDDELTGDDGDDQLGGGDGKDAVAGDDGHDRLAGGRGDDELTGDEATTDWWATAATTGCLAALAATG